MPKVLIKGRWSKEGYVSFRRSMVERGHWHSHLPEFPREGCFKCELDGKVTSQQK